MRYVIIDTSIYEKENYNFNTGVLSFFKKMCLEKKFTSLTHNVIDSEIVQHLKERAKEAGSLLIKAGKNFFSLKKHGKFKSVFELTNSEIEAALISEYNSYKAKLESIELKNNLLDIDKIVDDYFNHYPPFNEGMKKYEFPDAIILNSLKMFVLGKEDELLIASNDDDWKSFIKKHNIGKCYNSLYQLIKENVDDEKYLEIYNEQIEKWCNKNRDDILERLNSDLGNNFDFSATDNLSEELVDNDSVIVDFDEPRCIFFDDKSGSMSFDISITTKVDFTIEFDDYDNGYYDREDGIWYKLDKRQGRYRGEVIGVAIIGITAIKKGEYHIKIDDGVEIELLQHEIEGNIESLILEEVDVDTDIYHDEYED